MSGREARKRQTTNAMTRIIPLTTGWLNTPFARPFQFGESTMYDGHTSDFGPWNCRMLTHAE